MNKRPDFADRLKELRKEELITMEELAIQIGVGLGTVSRWESGLIIPRITSVVKLARFFKVSVGYMAGEED